MIKKIFVVSILAILTAAFVHAAGAADKGSSFSILEAGEKGAFNIGPAIGELTSKFEKSADKDVLVFDYSIFKGAIIGVWTKSFPDNLGASAADAVKIGVKAPNLDQLDQVSVKVEIKGIKDVQTIPVRRLKPGWNYVREAINWNTIGGLREVVFVVSPMKAGPSAGDPMWWFSSTAAAPMESAKKVDGILYLDLDFYKLTFIQKHAAFIKYGLVFLMSLVIALFAALIDALFASNRTSGGNIDYSRRSVLSTLRSCSGLILSKVEVSRFKRDFIYGIAAVFIIGVCFGVFSMGAINSLDAGLGFGFLAVGLAGALIAQILKKGLVGKSLTPVEIFQNILLTGFLAASSSRQALLQAPSSWSHILMLSNIAAALFFLIYHVSNTSSLASSGKHLKPITGALIVGAPYLFNWLLLLENASIPHVLGSLLTAGALNGRPVILEIIGRLIIVFVFNEAISNLISLAAKGKLVNTLKAHLFIFFVSLAIALSTDIADLGSSASVASLPIALRAIACVLTAMLSYAGLWGEVYLITGMILDGLRRIAPSRETISKNIITGMRKGMAYSGILMAFMYALKILLDANALQAVTKAFPIIVGILAGALVFPLLKTIIETFDGSIRFFERMRYSCRDVSLYARGAVAGYGFAYMVTRKLFQQEMPDRILFGLIIGLAASSGVSILRDIMYALRGRGKLQSWRLYFIDGVLGAFVGSAAAFYLDALQIPVIIEKFKLYTSSNFPAVDYITYPLVNKWGRVNLGTYNGGVKLLFAESVAGVINWSIAAWLFAVNKVFMQAYFDKDKTPIKFFFSKAGFAQLIEHMLYVLRWGLWMSPIIFTFLRMMPNPTWYNQDGAIRTVFAIYNNITMSAQDFQAWSLKIFIYILAFDFFRVLIWMDHMGLRVATLVNLSFIGLDKLDERIARFIGPSAAQRYIPEGVKRFATWAPLLIPFYLPRGQAWDYVWSTSEAIQNAAGGGGVISTLQSLALPQALALLFLTILICTGISFVIRSLYRRSRRRRENSCELTNREYKVVLKESGEAYSELIHKECDISRRSYDIIDPCGRVLYLVDASLPADDKRRYWPIAGNFPKDSFPASNIEKGEDSLKIVNTNNGVRTTIDIVLPDQDSTAEIWTITVENLTDISRRLKIIPYLEWVLNGGLHDRFHTQYARLYPEMEYASQANAILCWQKSTRSMGILAADIAAQGFLTSRVDFIGRARSIWSPRILETLNFLPAQDTAPYPTFDPIGSLMLDISIDPKASNSTRLLIGYSKNKENAISLINKFLKPQVVKAASQEDKKRSPLIGHGEIPPGTPRPYFKFIDNGNKLLIHTPFTPRPFDHAMSNAAHSVVVTNRGLHTSSNGNSQQNRLTPDWPDTVTKEIPTEAIYLYDPDIDEWYSPTYHPLNDPGAKNESEFGVDGTALFRMTHGTLSTELTVFVPPDDPAGVYLLTIKNNADNPRRLRIAPYFEMVLAFQPERSGPLQVRRDKGSNALFFENPRNTFRSGWAFVSMSIAAECMETKRGRFFGSGRSVTRPFMVEKGLPDICEMTDDRAIASFLGTVEIPRHGECTVAVILGQADSRKQAAALVQKYKDIKTARKSLEDTRKWWLGLMGTVVIETNSPEFDWFQNWLKYQALAERIWARRGFYQTSGAYGFRDQLQDTVNLIWVDPALARKQIILHASQQFLEGDVFHWFFTLMDGRTAFSCRSHASDNPLWLAWGVVEYIRAVGDYSILDEMTSYVVSEFPFAPLPKNKQGWGHLYHRSTKADSVYKHCMKSIDLVLKKRMGKNGLPLMGTGDWNDGLDEIGSEGKGESVWLGFFLYYILKDMVDIIERKQGLRRKERYLKSMEALKEALEKTWRTDRYLRAFHDDGTEIGVKGSGVWEIDALTAAWAVMSGINFERGLTIFNTALQILEKENVILLGWPALREDTKPYLGRSSKYPEGVRENGMYCHGVQWLIKAARILAEEFEKRADRNKAGEYRQIAYRLWLKIAAISHVTGQEIEIYGGQPNKQPADLLTKFDQGRMIWNGYTGAAGWMLRQALEGVVGASLIKNELILPNDLDKPRGELIVRRVNRYVSK